MKKRLGFAAEIQYPRSHASAKGVKPTRRKVRGFPGCFYETRTCVWCGIKQENLVDTMALVDIFSI